jgi:hypothetical protein
MFGKKGSDGDGDDVDLTSAKYNASVQAKERRQEEKDKQAQYEDKVGAQFRSAKREGNEEGTGNDSASSDEQATNKFFAWLEVRMRPVNRILKRLVFKTSMERLTLYAIILTGGYSVVISFMPLGILHFLLGNGWVSNRVLTNSVVRRTTDTLSGIAERYLRVPVAMAKLVIAIVLWLPLIVLALLTSPEKLRTMLALVALPAMACAFLWRVIPFMTVIPAVIRDNEALMMTLVAMATSAGIGGAMAVGMAFAPKLVRWALGEINIIHFGAALGAALVFGSFMAILHVEGNRTLGGATLSPHRVQLASITVSGMVVSLLALLTPFLNRPPVSRARLMGLI